jgi:peptidoglycan hydrolase-like protein with peptidoglycan-binding domain
MRRIVHALFAAAFLIPVSCLAQDALTSLHPEDAYPDDAPRMVSPGPWSDLTAKAQKKLRQLGFDAGPVNGDFGSKTQAALAQFQLSNMLPVNGALDRATLEALGLDANQDAKADSPENASTGG